MERNTFKQFIIDCMLFREKEALCTFFGIYAWLNVLIIILHIFSIISRHSN